MSVPSEGASSAANGTASSALADPAHPAHRMVLPAIRDITLVAGIYLFFAGFCHREFYLDLLGVPAGAEPSFNTVLVDAFAVFVGNLWLPIVLIAALCAASAPRVRAILDTALMPVLAGTAIAAFIALDVAAYNTAKKEVADLRRGTDSATVSMTFKSPLTMDKDLVNWLSLKPEFAKAYLVYATTDIFYVLIHHMKRTPTMIADPDETIGIPRSAVLLVNQSLEGM